MSSPPEIRPPDKLSATHDVSGFESGEPVLDDWLGRRALKNDASGASRTYVVCAGQTVVGYYTLAVGAVALMAATGRVRRNMPDPLPIMVPGRLAIDQKHQHWGHRNGIAARCHSAHRPSCGDCRYPSYSGPCPIRIREALL